MRLRWLRCLFADTWGAVLDLFWPDRGKPVMRRMTEEDLKGKHYDRI